MYSQPAGSARQLTNYPPQRALRRREVVELVRIRAQSAPSGLEGIIATSSTSYLNAISSPNAPVDIAIRGPGGSLNGWITNSAASLAKIEHYLDCGVHWAGSAILADVDVALRG